jgi:hypothetical protein
MRPVAWQPVVWKGLRVQISGDPTITKRKILNFAAVKIKKKFGPSQTRF